VLIGGGGGLSGHSEHGEEIDPGDEVMDGQIAHFLQKDFEQILQISTANPNIMSSMHYDPFEHDTSDLRCSVPIDEYDPTQLPACPRKCNCLFIYQYRK
jgi:hypothetical protein